MVKEIMLQAPGSRLQAKFFRYALCAMLYATFLCSCAKPIYKEKFVILGSYLEVLSASPDAGKVVYAEIKRLDKVFNFYDPHSLLYRLNNTYNTPFKVSKEFIELLKLSQEVNRVSQGAFDVSYGRLYDFWKELIKKGNIQQLPSKEEIERLKEIGGMQNIEIDEGEQSVIIKKEGLKIDFGGIATGYIVDKAVLRLKEKGIRSALINMGGDIYCLGTNGQRPWRVGIKDPEELSGIIEQETLLDEAITTSGNYEQFFELSTKAGASGQGGKRYSHIIDPRTGYPVENNIVSVSVISKNCTTADSLATAFFVMGLDGINNFLAHTPSTMRIFVITGSGKEKNIHMFR